MMEGFAVECACTCMSDASSGQYAQELCCHAMPQSRPVLSSRPSGPKLDLFIS